MLPRVLATRTAVLKTQTKRPVYRRHTPDPKPGRKRHQNKANPAKRRKNDPRQKVIRKPPRPPPKSPWPSPLAKRARNGNGKSPPALRKKRAPPALRKRRAPNDNVSANVSVDLKKK